MCFRFALGSRVFQTSSPTSWYGTVRGFNPLCGSRVFQTRKNGHVTKPESPSVSIRSVVRGCFRPRGWGDEARLPLRFNPLCGSRVFQTSYPNGVNTNEKLFQSALWFAGVSDPTL